MKPIKSSADDEENILPVSKDSFAIRFGYNWDYVLVFDRKKFYGIGEESDIGNPKKPSIIINVRILNHIMLQVTIRIIHKTRFIKE